MAWAPSGCIRWNPAAVPARPMAVNPLRFLVDAFVNTFGITQPTPETEARAGRAIALMLVAVFVVLATVGWVLRSAFTR